MKRIPLPLGVVSALLYVFLYAPIVVVIVFSFNAAKFFTTGPGATTLPILIYTSVRRGVTPDINALSTLLVLASIIGTIGVALMQRPRKPTGGWS